MTGFIVCNASGNILRTGYCPFSMLALQMGLDEFVLEVVADDKTQWVNTETWAVEDRPTMSLTVTDTTISNIPSGAIVSIGGQQYQIDDGAADLEFDIPGLHRVRVECFPYLSVDLEIES